MELVVALKIIQHALIFHVIWCPIAYSFVAVNMPSDRKLHCLKQIFSLSLKLCVRCHFVTSFPSEPCFHARCYQQYVVVHLDLYCLMSCLSILELCSLLSWGVENAMWLILADCSDVLFSSQLLNRCSVLVVSYMKLAQNLVQFHIILLVVCFEMLWMPFAHILHSCHHILRCLYLLNRSSVGDVLYV